MQFDQIPSALGHVFRREGKRGTVWVREVPAARRPPAPEASDPLGPGEASFLCGVAEGEGMCRDGRQSVRKHFQLTGGTVRGDLPGQLGGHEDVLLSSGQPDCGWTGTP